METSQNTKNLITQVDIDILAAMKIVKHCDDHLPSFVTGYLLGVDAVSVLEVSYSYPIIDSKGEDMLDDEFQAKTMGLLSEVGIDNHCVGWYQSLPLGDIFSSENLTCQFTYQNVSENSILIIYDPIQSQRGGIVLKAFRLGSEYFNMRAANKNDHIHPKDIFEEIPVNLKSVGYTSAFIRCLNDFKTFESEFSPLSMTSSDTHIEQQLESMTEHIEALSQEQMKFVYHMRLQKQKNQFKGPKRFGRENEEVKRDEQDKNKPVPAPPRLDVLLGVGQLDIYADQVRDLTSKNLQNLSISTKVNVEQQH